MTVSTVVADIVSKLRDDSTLQTLLGSPSATHKNVFGNEPATETVVLPQCAVQEIGPQSKGAYERALHVTEGLVQVGCWAATADSDPERDKKLADQVIVALNNVVGQGWEFECFFNQSTGGLFDERIKARGTVVEFTVHEARGVRSA